MFEKIKKQRRLDKMQRRMIEFGQIFDTIDMTLVKNKKTDKERVDFWMEFFGSQTFRRQYIRAMVEGNR